MCQTGPTLVLAVALCACSGASYPVPVQRMVDAKVSARAAEEGAQSSPQARLHVALAKEALTRADVLVAEGDNRRADYELVRAKSDADLAVALEQDQTARSQAALARAQAGYDGGLQ